jgi:hypothetical protein
VKHDLSKKKRSSPGVPQRSSDELRWYSMEHHHSGIALLTPHQVHHGLSELVIRQRQEILTQAYARHPERFVRRAPKALELPSAVWINPPPAKSEQNQAPGNFAPQSDPPGCPINDDLESTRPLAPPETASLATPRKAERGDHPSQETTTASSIQPAPRANDPDPALPNDATAFNPPTERTRPRRGAAALQ